MDQAARFILALGVWYDPGTAYAATSPLRRTRFTKNGLLFSGWPLRGKKSAQPIVYQ
ncbi:MAG TPA: hypothetical protein PLO62_03180 [Candidatus Hydrogenedentes bacterium]|nr:hypothetical protein [Candidatus Hydrogenedentota bacterium]HOS03950.1 hypothetical protein [Candidatus Hydrogenedentota bacterium]